MTTDSCQAVEYDIVILHIHMVSAEELLGFIAAQERFLVAISRARQYLFVIGNYNFLARVAKYENRSHKMVNAILSRILQRECIITVYPVSKKPIPGIARCQVYPENSIESQLRSDAHCGEQYSGIQPTRTNYAYPYIFRRFILYI